MLVAHRTSRSLLALSIPSFFALNCGVPERTSDVRRVSIANLQGGACESGADTNCPAAPTHADFEVTICTDCAAGTPSGCACADGQRHPLTSAVSARAEFADLPAEVPSGWFSNERIERDWAAIVQTLAEAKTAYETCMAGMGSVTACAPTVYLPTGEYMLTESVVIDFPVHLYGDEPTTTTCSIHETGYAMASYPDYMLANGGFDNGTWLRFTFYLNLRTGSLWNVDDTVDSGDWAGLLKVVSDNVTISHLGIDHNQRNAQSTLEDERGLLYSNHFDFETNPGAMLSLTPPFRNRYWMSGILVGDEPVRPNDVSIRNVVFWDYYGDGIAGRLHATMGANADIECNVAVSTYFVPRPSGVRPWMMPETQYHGISLYDAVDATVAHNSIYGSGDDAIGVHGGEGVVVANNAVHTVGGRIYVDDCGTSTNGCQITDNDVTMIGHRGDAILITTGSEQVEVAYNNINVAPGAKLVAAGIAIEDATYVNVHDNTVDEQTDSLGNVGWGNVGVEVKDNASNVTITDNTFTGLWHGSLASEERGSCGVRRVGGDHDHRQHLLGTGCQRVVCRPVHEYLLCGGQ